MYEGVVRSRSPAGMTDKKGKCKKQVQRQRQMQKAKTGSVPFAALRVSMTRWWGGQSVWERQKLSVCVDVRE
jgi:hypothetical protein